MPIDEIDLQRLNDRYMTREECANKMNESRLCMEKMRLDIHDLTVKMRVLLKVITIIGSAIVAPLVAIAIKVIFGG